MSPRTERRLLTLVVVLAVLAFAGYLYALVPLVLTF